MRLDPAMPVLLRPDGAVQVGWDPMPVGKNYPIGVAVDPCTHAVYVTNIARVLVIESR